MTPRLSDIQQFIVDTYNANLSATLGPIWDFLAPEEQDYPFVTYQMIGDVPFRDFCNDFSDLNWQFSIYCPPSAAYISIDLMKDTFNNLTGTLSATTALDFRNTNAFMVGVENNTNIAQCILTYDIMTKHISA